MSYRIAECSKKPVQGSGPHVSGAIASGVFCDFFPRDLHAIASDHSQHLDQRALVYNPAGVGVRRGRVAAQEGGRR